MQIIEIKENKKRYLELLLMADEQESMIDKYLNRGTMYAVTDKGIKAECVVTDEGNKILEIKNIAVLPDFRGHGCGRMLIQFLKEKYRDRFRILQAGTGDSPLTVPFYEKCGFKRSHCIKNFFTDNYDHPIFENGIQLVDMIYMQTEI